MGTYPSEIAEMLNAETERRELPMPLIWQCYPTTFLMFEGDKPPVDDEEG